MKNEWCPPWREVKKGRQHSSGRRHTQKSSTVVPLQFDLMSPLSEHETWASMRCLETVWGTQGWPRTAGTSWEAAGPLGRTRGCPRGSFIVHKCWGWEEKRLHVWGCVVHAHGLGGADRRWSLCKTLSKPLTECSGPLCYPGASWSFSPKWYQICYIWNYDKCYL